MDDSVLKVENLSIGIHKDRQIFKAVDNISFEIRRGEILGIVGESGCGKSVTALSIQDLLADGVSVTDGKLLFHGKDLLSMSAEEKRNIYGKDISMIYQEPMTSLNPLIKIGKQVGEVLRLHSKKNPKEIQEEVLRVLTEVGLPDPVKSMNSYPHQLSGGMRQRVMIAMAIICNPQLLIADEPTTALDVTTQAQVLNLIKRINKESNTSILFISHDLGVINRLCDRVIVMYAGKIVEMGATSDILSDPIHEYTKGLIHSIPTRKQKGTDLKCIKGKVPSVTEEKPACPFAARCEKAIDLCYAKAPSELQWSDGHVVWCHKVNVGS